MKSRASEKPAKKKTKSTTAAKSVKKQAKKSVRASAKKKTVAKKVETAAKKKTPTEAAAKSLPPEPAEVKTASPSTPPPPPEPVPPPVTPSPSFRPGNRKGILTGRRASGFCEARPDRTGWKHPSRLGNVDWRPFALDGQIARTCYLPALNGSRVRRVVFTGVKSAIGCRYGVGAKRPVVAQATEPVADNEEEMIDELEVVEGTPNVSSD